MPYHLATAPQPKKLNPHRLKNKNPTNQSLAVGHILPKLNYNSTRSASPPQSTQAHNTRIHNKPSSGVR
jgi:hypothetical protein